MASSVVTAFLGAFQAALSVLLTVIYGVVAAQFDLLTSESAKNVSKICVRMFLPALLFSNVGSQLDLQSGSRYLPIIIWSLIYNAVSISIGIVATRVLKLPGWVTPAITFNNTTALPLLLMSSLDASGILETLAMGPDDSSAAILKRANSYFLINAMIGDSLTFGVGPKLLEMHEEDAPEDRPGNGKSSSPTRDENGDAMQGGVEEENDDALQDAIEEAIIATEETSLLPDRVVRAGVKWEFHAYRKGRKQWAMLPAWLQATVGFLYECTSAPLIGTVIGAVVGLTPPLHRAFFNSPEDGGIFTSWLSESIGNIGDLFPALQVVVVGVKLSQSMRKMKQGEDSGDVPWITVAIITTLRFIIWPLISIPIIYAIASRTHLLSADPILWFTLMLMPVGPPALKLTAMADVCGADESEKMAIAKLLTISYVLSPLISLAVVGCLKASQAAM